MTSPQLRDTSTPPDGWIPEPLDLLLGFEPGGSVQQEPRDAWDTPWHPEMAYQFRPTEAHHWKWLRRNLGTLSWINISRRIAKVENREYLIGLGRESITKLINRGTIDMSDLPDADRGRAEEALSYAAGILKDPDAKRSEGLTAARIILDFCKAKPASKSEVTIARAEDFLNGGDDED